MIHSLHSHSIYAINMGPSGWPNAVAIDLKRLVTV